MPKTLQFWKFLSFNLIFTMTMRIRQSYFIFEPIFDRIFTLPPMRTVCGGGGSSGCGRSPSEPTRLPAWCARRWLAGQQATECGVLLAFQSWPNFDILLKEDLAETPQFLANLLYTLGQIWAVLVCIGTDFSK